MIFDFYFVFVPSLSLIYCFFTYLLGDLMFIWKFKKCMQKQNDKTDMKALNLGSFKEKVTGYLIDFPFLTKLR